MGSRCAVRFSSKLKELRIHLCQESANSKGARTFVENYYVPLKLENPKFPILIRECSNVQPALWARFDYGIEKSIPLSDVPADEILEKIKSLC